MKKFTEKDYSEALHFAEKKHKGQYRIGGDEYITHPVAVADILKNKGYGTEYRIAGLFHDLLEDTDATIEEIENLSSPEIAKSVSYLTKEDGYVMEKYVDGIRSDKIAFAVKCADRLHNLRSAVCASDDFKRKYINETIEWYWNFSDDIRKSARALAETLEDNNIVFPD